MIDISSGVICGAPTWIKPWGTEMNKNVMPLLRRIYSKVERNP